MGKVLLGLSPAPVGPVAAFLWPSASRQSINETWLGQLPIVVNESPECHQDSGGHKKSHLEDAFEVGHVDDPAMLVKLG
jgi:hypothetical protein